MCVKCHGGEVQYSKEAYKKRTGQWDWGKLARRNEI